MAQIPESFTDLLTEKLSIGHLATIMPDGTPQVSPVWVDYDGENVLVNSTKNLVKDRNISARPDVALSITDPDNPFRYLLIRGEVIEIVDDVSREHQNKLIQRYTNEELSWQPLPPERVRRIYKIAPKSVVTVDNPNRHRGK